MRENVAEEIRIIVHDGRIDFNAVDKKECGVLEYACMHGDTEIINILVNEPTLDISLELAIKCFMRIQTILKPAKELQHIAAKLGKALCLAVDCKVEDLDESGKFTELILAELATHNLKSARK